MIVIIFLLGVLVINVALLILLGANIHLSNKLYMEEYERTFLEKD
jgi:hypothetical protein